MLNKLSLIIIQNKNLLMLISAAIYVVSLCAVLYKSILLVSFIFTVLSLFLIIKNLFPIKYIVIWTFLFYFGIVNTSFRIRDVDELYNLAPVNSEISGTIVSIPQGITEGKPKFFFNVDKIRFDSVVKDLKSEKVLVTMNDDFDNKDLKLYNSGILKGRLSVPFKAGNPSQFDYGNYLRNHNAYAVFYAKSFEKCEKDISLKRKFMQKISDYRENILATHAKYLPSPNLEILGGIVFGDDAVSPPKYIKNSFVNSGLLHILAASGMNVAFIYTFFFFFMSIFKVNYKVKVLSGMAMVVVYSLMTGLGASVIRASFMLLFVLAGKLIDRDAHSISLLSFVALLMLLYNPLFINDIGFQLSFIVTFGILIMSAPLIRFKSKILNFIISTIMIPIIAQLWVIPVQIFYFNNISLYSVFANIMSVPILMVLSFGGFVSSLLAGVPFIADFICKTFDLVLNPLLIILVNISDFWGHLPNSTLQTTHPSIYQILIYYSMLLCLTGLCYKGFREKYSKYLLISFCISLIIWLLTLIPIKNSNLEILTFDVGNADCFLIKSPANEYIMIDTGKAGYNGGKSQAEIIVLKYLKDRGIKNIDSVIVTHFDNDHCGGAVDILNALNINSIYVNDLNHNSNSAKNIYKAALQNHTDLVLAKNNQVIYDNKGLKLTNFMGKSSDSDNENSIVTILEYEGFKMLFTGDIGSLALKDMLNQLPKDLTVLKVPHHGAVGGLDKEVVTYLNPEFSIISVGENKFGHPSIYTLSLLKESNILRTDIHNSILIAVDKNKFKLKVFDLKSKTFKLFAFSPHSR